MPFLNPALGNYSKDIFNRVRKKIYFHQGEFKICEKK